MEISRLSFLAKISRAEHHLRDLEDALTAFGGSSKDTRPYTVSASIERKQNVHRFEFTKNVVNTDIPLIAGDAFSNLRASLDHLIAQMLSASAREGVMFPDPLARVWEPPVPGENPERTKARERWNGVARHLKEEPLAILRELQPPDDPLNRITPHPLRLLNSLANKDRHKRLPVYASGVETLWIDWLLPDGTIRSSRGTPDAGRFVADQAKIHGVPPGAVYVEAYGPPVVVIRTGMQNTDGVAQDLPLPGFIGDLTAQIRDKIVPALSPCLWTKRG